MAGFEHSPVAGSQAAAAWHWSGCGQAIALPPTHAPLWHVSVCVHALPSLQTGPVSSAQVPLTAAPATTEHASHGPALQAVLQQTPSAQLPLRQAEPAAQAAPFAALPPTGSKSSAVAR